MKTNRHNTPNQENITPAALAAANQKLAVSRYQKYEGLLQSSLERETLLDIAKDALQTASESFAPGLGFCFSTYAVKCIDNALSRGYAKLSRRRLYVSLDEEVGDGLSRHEWLEDTAAVSPVEALMDREEYVLLFRALDGLDAEDSRLLRRVYGMGCEPVKLYDLACEAGVTSARMSQRKKQAEHRPQAAYLSMADCPLPSAA